MRKPMHPMAEMAAEMDSRLIDGEQPERMHVTVKTELIVRSSTGRVPND
jgi:DNA-binding LacI/PurR family transcriptional regulator